MLEPIIKLGIGRRYLRELEIYAEPIIKLGIGRRYLREIQIYAGTY